MNPFSTLESGTHAHNSQGLSMFYNQLCGTHAHNFQCFYALLSLTTPTFLLSLIEYGSLDLIGFSYNLEIYE